ncbi:MAG: hypothetical protein UY72_C0006G0016 [Candidatus Uhrbacteria bacterium GW2011_GWD2_52_7]|uniref:Uncharacterized protein n=1 Tax=Candidatus Uhrbacteria bacterium GW2011_GWD2_52_7 TaxID=1618989 RepID=A0A0G1XIE2_9BACT|nr:MAG: hypothetical protein UY72_C0006G0016 [Candidatus Uhrbacteria bacterium GW2011_GWD2_52_7]
MEQMPETTVSTQEDGQVVIDHCFFDVSGHGFDYWEKYGDAFQAIGCTVTPIKEPRLHFRVTFPQGTVYQRVPRRNSDLVVDVFVLPGGYVLYMKEPDPVRLFDDQRCWTLQSYRGQLAFDLPRLLIYGTFSDVLLDAVTNPNPALAAA